VLVSNKIAVEAMGKKAEELGLQAKIISTELYAETTETLKKIFKAQAENTVVLAAGEPELKVPKGAGVGGRNLHIGLQAIERKLIGSDSVFLSFASDGIDNSEVAGAIVDKNTLTKAEKLNLQADDYLARFDSYNFFQKFGDLILTGPTGANVSDLMILLTKK
jgi:glycerate-2-kinase